LLTAGVETDVLGIGGDDLPCERLAAVIAAHPRPDFKRRILQAFTDGNKHPLGLPSAMSTLMCSNTSIRHLSETISLRSS